MTLTERRDALDALLVSTSALWQPSTFHERRPAWCAEYPEMTVDLLALDDATLHSLSETASLSSEYLATYIPDLHSLPDSTRLPQEPPAPASRRNDNHGISEKKAGQIDAFVAAVGKPQAKLLDWCAGKGHLSRRFLAKWGGEALAVERNATLCASGEVLNQRDQFAHHFLTADVMKPSTAESLRDTHAVALHACGDLHLHLARAAASIHAPALDIAPCCYQLTSAESYQPMSRSSSLRLSRNALKLAVTETTTTTARRIAASERASAWKLAFVCLREESAPRNYQSFRPVPSNWQQEGFESFLKRLAERENVRIPPNFDFKQCEAAGWKRHHESRRLQLIRLSFRRAIEVWLLCDLALWLEQQGYEVKLREFCSRALTPRNLLLSARLV